MIVVLIGLALFAAGMWAAWLGWDNEYYVVDGHTAGPYREFQVIGCGVCVVLASVVASLYLRRPSSVHIVAAVAVLGFSIPWAIDAARTDSSGLWGVGLIMLLVGGFCGVIAVLAIANAVAARFATRRG